MKDTIIINGKELDWVEIGEGFEIPSYNFQTETAQISGRHGSVFRHRKMGELDVTVPLLLKNEWFKYNKNFDDVTNELVKFFDYGNEPVKFQVKSKKWYWYAYIEGPIEILNTTEQFMNIELKLKLLDPYKYSVDGSTNTAIGDAVSVVNVGTADTPFIVEARALKPSSYFMITKGDEDYFMIGDDEVTKEVKNYMPPVFHSEFRDFKGWNKMTNEDIPSNDLGGKVGGNFVRSNLNEGFRAQDFPAGNGWVGAGTMRGLPKTMKDFQITYKCIVEQKDKGAGRTAQHIYDDAGKLMASIGYENKYHDRKIGHVVVTLYNQNGDPQKIYDHQNRPLMYKKDRIVVYIRLRRVGNKYSIRTWKFDHIKDPDRTSPIDVDEKEWVDGGNFYQRPAAKIAIYSAKYNGYKWMEMNGLGSFNTEILPKPKGARDMIIQEGDLIKIDMHTKNVVINEEPGLPHKTLGSDWLTVNPGHTELVIQPENIFDTKIKWQDRYL